MPTYQDDPVVSKNHNSDSSEFGGGVYGESKVFNGVRGITHAPGHGAVVGVSEVPTPNPPDPTKDPGPGVYGQSNSAGVVGVGKTWHGVYGKSEEGGHGVNGEGPVGVSGIGKTWHGVHGKSEAAEGHGVSGEGSVGVSGIGSTWIGVYGETNADPTAGSCGVLGEGQSGGVGVKGHARGPGMAGVAGYQLANQGPGIYGEGAPAGYFKGDVHVTGDLILEGADYAEELTVAEPSVEAGMVVVLDDEGRIKACNEDYDPRVAGIVSGAGGVRPGMVLDRHDGGAPVALMGKLWVMADATESPIRCADLLTTSSTRGHARRVTERARAFGAVIGKALTELPSGRGMVRVLVSAS